VSGDALAERHYEPVIGLEIHVQLKTRTKMFCGCALSFGEEPNTRTCPICLGHPGTLPVTNAEAVHFGLMIAMALECEVAPRSIFHRKNYFYPDLPKGYQISQYDIPLARDGMLGDVRIHRVHLEEDAAKLVHAGSSGRIHGAEASVVDFNRGGTPLAEIVTGASGSLLSLGVLAALWAASSGMLSIMTALNVAYRVVEHRPWWRIRLTALALTCGFSAFALVGLLLLVFGGGIGRVVAGGIGLGGAFTLTWAVLQWPAAILLVVTALSLVYWLAPAAGRRWSGAGTRSALGAPRRPPPRARTVQRTPPPSPRPSRCSAGAGGRSCSPGSTPSTARRSTRCAASSRPGASRRSCHRRRRA